MKALLALLLMTSFSASAYDINNRNEPVPAEVEQAIRERFDKDCGSFAFSIVNLNLDKFAFRDEIYELSYSIQYEYWNGIDYMDVQVKYPEARILKFNTVSGQDGSDICLMHK